ncbi:uncharacterized protein LOC114533073 [Dendronephthya gigantea]|uniref:uncharacterized protein LOC114533073 n=1 Tax=Dendronephthya gigantea TaxID=151771 RepID=UPI00106B4A70|nr:uncharacterized protein LOC114533073 [Dendronephthya gigantea]
MKFMKKHDHLRRSHSNDPSFHVVCGLDGCPRTYKRVESFRNHLIRKHNIYGKENEPIMNNNDVPRDVNMDVDDENNPAIQAEPAHVLAENMLRDNALCLFGFKDKGRVTQTVVNLFAESSTQMVRNSLNIAMSEIKERLAAVGQAIEDIPGLQQIFDQDSSAMNPLRGIETEQKQHQYNLNHFNLVEPRKIVLHRSHVKVRRGRQLKVVEKTDDAFYIPLLESLQQLLNDESILEEVENPHARDDGYLDDFCDTDYSALYYTLGNIKPCNRSHMNAVQLLGLITCKHLKLYGIEPLLEAFMEDLHKLEQDLVQAMNIDNLRRLALELLRRQAAAFADIVNGELVSGNEPHQTQNLIMMLQIGASVGAALLCPLKKRTNAAPDQDVLVSQEQTFSIN